MHQGDGGLAARGARRSSSSTRPLASATARNSRATPSATPPTAGCPPCGSWWRSSAPTSTPATTTAIPRSAMPPPAATTGMILYLVERGADLTAVARSGQTTVALLERLGAKDNHRCVSC